MKNLLLLIFFIVPFHAQSGLLDMLGLNADNPLSVDAVFVFSADINDAKSVLASWQIAEGNYLYRDKIRFELVGNDGVQLLSFSLPDGETRTDKFFGPTNVYYQDIEVLLSLQKSNQEEEVILRAHYQGCSATFNICYPPVQRDVSLLLPAINISDILARSGNPPQISMQNEPIISRPGAMLSQQDCIAQRLVQGNILKVLAGFFVLGLLLSFTPCTFPMLPILSSIIAGKGERVTRQRAFILSSVYVLAMAITYSIAGILTGFLGESIQALLQNSWIIGAFSALMIVLASSMFGLFDLQLPQSMRQFLHQFGHRRQSGHIIGAGLMGLLSVLIVGPCLTPPLAGALIFIGNQGDPVLGGAALFALSIGMGLPLLIIGTCFGALLPKAGAWMNAIKAIIGVLMLALAIWMLERIIPGWMALLLWGSLCIVTAVYMGAFNALNMGVSGWYKLWKGIGLLLLIYGSLLIVGGTSGSHNLWQPLDAIVATGSIKRSARATFIKVGSLMELQQQLSHTDSPAMVNFYADWCVECKIMETTTFHDSRVVEMLAEINAFQIDMTDNTDQHKALLKHFGLFGPPALLFFDRDGNEYIHHRWIGSISASRMLTHLASLPDQAK